MASQVALVVKNTPVNATDIRDAGLIAGSGRSPGGGHGNPLQYPCLGNPMDREAWRATVCSVAKSRTRLKRLSPAQQRWNKDSAETLPLEKLPCCTSVILQGSRAIFSSSSFFFIFSIIQLTRKELSIEILTFPFHALSFLPVEEWGSTKLSGYLRGHTSVRHPHHSSFLIPRPRTFLERSILLETSHLWK